LLFTGPTHERVNIVNIVAIGIVCALGVYYLAWARFFANGGRVSLLSASLFGIPSPLALARNV
jgi:type IV secretory pathway VirB2 component (pilin)